MNSSELDEEEHMSPVEESCQICLDPQAKKMDTSLFNCSCTFYSHPRCFKKFINSQQRYKTYLDCPICHSRVDLSEAPRVLAIVATVFIDRQNENIQDRIRSINFTLFVMGLYIFFWCFFLVKQSVPF